MSTYQRNTTQTITPSSPMEVVLTEGSAITFDANDQSAGTLTRYTAAGTFVESKSIPVGISNYGGNFAGSFVVMASTAAGSIDATVGDAVLGAAKVTRPDTATAVLADPANPTETLSVTAFSDERKEGRWSDAGALRTMYADIRNPHATLALTSYPVRIAIGFGQGEVFSPDQLRLRDAAGAIVPWQWEGGEHPRTGASLEFWPDGSLRCGDIWFNLTAAAGVKSRYLIEKHPVPLGQSFSQNVVYSAVSGTVDQLQTTGITARFESGQAWNLRRYQDRANSDQDLFSGSLGVYTKVQLASGVVKSSTNSADVTLVSHGVIGASSFGNGVVFQRYETNYTFTDGTGIANRVRYRMFADGSIRVEDKKLFPADLAQASRWNVLQLAASGTGVTAATDTAKWNMTFEYAGGNGTSKFLFGAYAMQREHPVDDGRTVSYLPAALAETSTLARVGWASNVSILAGLEQRNVGFLCKYSAGDAANEHVRRFNRIAAIAAQPRPETDLAALRRLTVAWAKTSQPTMTVEGWGGVSALTTLFLTQDANAALAEYQAFSASKGANPALSSDYLAMWRGTIVTQGYEYQGRNTQVLWWLREAFRKSGDTARQTLVESYIHAYADFCVKAESISGGDPTGVAAGNGQLWLSEGAPFYAWNAGTSALAGLAASLAITANAGRQAVFDRIASTFSSNRFAGPIWTYGSATNPITEPTTHYSGYQLFELGRAFKLRPVMTLPAGDMCNYLVQSLVPEGIANEWLSNLRYRQGSWATHVYAASCCALLNNDYSTAYEYARHIQQATLGNVAASNLDMDGWSRTSGAGSGMDVRVLIEMFNWVTA